MTAFIKTRKHWREFGPLYILSLPGMIYLIMFCFIPMLGLLIVFKDYNFKQGIFGSPWVGFKNFEFFFYNIDIAWRATWNTIFLNFCFITTGTAAAVALALILNDVKDGYFKKVCQSVTIFPFFMSWVVIGGIFLAIINYDGGAFNNLLTSLGFERVDFFNQPGSWPFILTFAKLWQGAGYSSIIYLGVVTGISQELYEAATVDGATRLQKALRITLPLLKPTIAMMVILAIGRILYGDFTMIYGMTRNNPLILSTTDVIDTYVYRAVMGSGDFSMASAIGLYQSIFGVLLVLVANYLAGKADESYKIF